MTIYRLDGAGTCAKEVSFDVICTNRGYVSCETTFTEPVCNRRVQKITRCEVLASASPVEPRWKFKSQRYRGRRLVGGTYSAQVEERRA